MKIFLALALAATVAFSLSGCLEAEVKPVEPQKVESTTLPLPTASQPAEPVAAVPAVVAPAPVVTAVPVVEVPAVPVPAIPVIPATAPVDPLDEWFKNPTFTCEPGRAPGWLNEQGIPTGCVAN